MIAHKHDATHVVPLDYVEMKKLKEIKHKDKPTKALLINETSIKLNNAIKKTISQNQTEIEYKIQFETPSLDLTSGKTSSINSLLESR